MTHTITASTRPNGKTAMCPIRVLRELGAAIFEIATDHPGSAVDEPWTFEMICRPFLSRTAVS
jgi:hypothetical protein